MKRKYSLRLDEARDKWILKNDMTDKIVRVYDTKEDATRAGALRKALGRQGGSVMVRKSNGVLEEERTFPGLD